MKKYKFALADIMHDLKLENPNQLYRRYFEGHGLSKQSIYALCDNPTQVKIETINTICNVMGLEPSDLWRVA